MFINIALVSFEFPPITATGGIGSYMQHIASFLASKGHNIVVFSALPGGKSLEIVYMENCINYRVPAMDNKDFRENVLPVFEKYYTNNNVDVIESPEVGACALHIKERFPKLKLVVRMHTPGVLITKINNSQKPFLQNLRFVIGSLLKGKIDLGYWAIKDKNRHVDVEYQICQKADILISPSEALKQWAVKFWGIPSCRIQVLSNPFSLQSNLFSLSIKNRPLVISFVGKLSILKGMKSLAEAIPLILEKNKEYIIFLVGRDEIENGQSMMAYMKTKLEKYKLKVYYTGSVNQEALHEIYAQSKVCIFPSLWENYPTVILEAMAAGATVVAADRGGIPEMVKNNITGMLFDALNPYKLAMIVNELLVDETKRLMLAKNARQELMDKIYDEHYEKELLNVYTHYEKKETTL